MNIEELFPDGNWRGDNYVIRCPFCPDGDHPTHNHCAIILVDGPHRFYCYRCGEGGCIAKLLEECDKRVKIEPRKGTTEKKKYKQTDFAQFKKVVGSKGALGRLALSYLKNKRRLTEEEIQLYDIRYTSFSDSRYYGRVLIPICENDTVVSFIGRAFLPFVRPPYLFPHHGETLLTTSEAIFEYNKVVDKSRGLYVIVEGVFDAIRVNRRRDLGIHGLAVLSNQLSVGQLFKLLRLREPGFFVMLDADAHSEGLKIAERLWKYGRGVKLCLLNSGDPDSLTDKEFDKAINKAFEQEGFDGLLDSVKIKLEG